MTLKSMKLLLILTFLCTIIIPFQVESEQFIEGFSIASKESIPYKGPTTRQIASESSDKIFRHLKAQGVPEKHWPFLNQIVSYEERGCFGYHAAKQKFRIFQDIVKIIFEEILDYEIDRDFHFLRIPLSSILHEYPTAYEFLKKYPNVSDGEPEQRDQLVAMNYTLFGNYDRQGSCTALYFSKNKSARAVKYEDQLKFLFNQLGMPISEISSLYSIGSPIDKSETGVIFQFFDMSHNCPNHKNGYEVVDEVCYPSLGGGKYDKQVKVALSDIFQGNRPKKFDQNHGQIRIIINTTTSLNPYYVLRIRRFDRIPLHTIQSYEKSLRERIRHLPRDKKKVIQYKEKLKCYWH